MVKTRRFRKKIKKGGSVKRSLNGRINDCQGKGIFIGIPSDRLEQLYINNLGALRLNKLAEIQFPDIITADAVNKMCRRVVRSTSELDIRHVPIYSEWKLWVNNTLSKNRASQDEIAEKSRTLVKIKDYKDILTKSIKARTFDRDEYWAKLPDAEVCTGCPPDNKCALCGHTHWIKLLQKELDDVETVLTKFDIFSTMLGINSNTGEATPLFDKGLDFETNYHAPWFQVCYSKKKISAGLKKRLKLMIKNIINREYNNIFIPHLLNKYSIDKYKTMLNSECIHGLKKKVNAMNLGEGAKDELIRFIEYLDKEGDYVDAYPNNLYSPDESKNGGGMKRQYKRTRKYRMKNRNHKKIKKTHKK